MQMKMINDKNLAKKMFDFELEICLMKLLKV